MDSQLVNRAFSHLRTSLVEGIQKLDPEASYQNDTWTRPNEGGGGEANCFFGNNVLEKGGINFSHIRGASLPPSATQARPQLKEQPFEAMGVSVVFHPVNPYVPTTHMNVRFFTTHPTDGQDPVWWFGGGFDLTPYYPLREDVIHWHQSAKNACDPYGTALYSRFKAECDRYFFLPHRQETRGVGGLFFDDFNELGFEASFNMTLSIAETFFPTWKTIVERRHSMAYGDREKNFQKYRRGRYVEFNLLYDRGTLFGLQSGGRTESILMSLPPEVNWQYNWQPEPDSPEAELYDQYLKPCDWLNEVS